MYKVFGIVHDEYEEITRPPSYAEKRNNLGLQPDSDTAYQTVAGLGVPSFHLSSQRKGIRRRFSDSLPGGMRSVSGESTCPAAGGATRHSGATDLGGCCTRRVHGTHRIG